MTSTQDARVLILEPVLLTGSGIARTAAALRESGAAYVAALVGETMFGTYPTAAALGLDDLFIG